MRALIGLDDGVLSRFVEEALKRKGFAFLRGKGSNVTEYEVTSPHRFLVTVENTTREKIWFPFRGARVESALEVKRKIGANEPDDQLRQCVAEFLNTLCGSMPSETWHMFRIAGPGAETGDWRDLWPSNQ